MSDLLQLTRRYFAALEGGATGAALAAFYAPRVAQVEFPNRFAPQGAERGLPELLAAAERGRKLMAEQRYDIDRAVAAGRAVAVEFRWSGTLAVDVGSLKAGTTMRGFCATFLEFDNERIVAQRNYDCYEP